MKIWIKLIIVGITIFFAGVFYAVSQGEGTVLLSDGMKISWIGLFLIFLGVATGVGISIYGIWRSNQTRKQEIKKEDMEIIQSYGQQMSEIVTSEQNLETKLDCS